MPPKPGTGKRRRLQDASEMVRLEARISSVETASKKMNFILTRVCRVIMKLCQDMGVEHHGLQEAIRELRGQIQTTDDEEELLAASSQVGPSMYEVGLSGPSGSSISMISTPGSWHSMLSDQGHKKGKAVVDDDDEVSSNV